MKVRFKIRKRDGMPEIDIWYRLRDQLIEFKEKEACKVLEEFSRRHWDEAFTTIRAGVAAPEKIARSNGVIDMLEDGMSQVDQMIKHLDEKIAGKNAS